MAGDLQKLKESMEWCDSDHIDAIVEDIKEDVVEVVEEVVPKMNAFIDKFNLFADLTDDGVVDIADWKKGMKWFGVIYSGLLSMMYVILGSDYDALVANTYFAVTFGIISFIVTIIAVMSSKKLNRKDKEIKALKSKNRNQASLLYQQEMEMEQLNHSHILDIQEKDFMIKIKDTLYNAERLKQEKPE